MRRAAFLVFATIALGVAAVPFASAAVRTRTATASGQGSFVTATATCPGRSKAIDGGFLAPPVKAGGGALVVVFESRKVGARAWRASGQVVDLTTPADRVSLTSYVYCRNKTPRTRVVAAVSSTPAIPNQFLPNSLATCAPRRKAVAGGFLTGPQLPVPPPGANFVNLAYESFRANPAAWSTSVVTGTGVPGTVTTFAYCAKVRRAPAQAAGRGKPSTSSQNQSTVTARCARGATLSGGFSNLGAGLGPGVFYPYESRRQGSAWRVSGLSQGNGPITVVAHAYCG